MEPTRAMIATAIKVIEANPPTATTPLLIAQAIAAERERCAKIAETAGCGDPKCMDCYGNRIAAEIREPL